MRLAEVPSFTKTISEAQREVRHGLRSDLPQFFPRLNNMPPTISCWALNGKRTSATVYSVRSRDAMLVLALHDGSGREVEIARAELKRVVDNPHIGHRFAFTLTAERDKPLRAEGTEWLAPGQTE